MDEILLTFHCAVSDADSIAQVLRAETGHPVHVSMETVHGHDFSDAKVKEQVTGTLSRAAVAVAAPRDKLESLVEAAGSARRGHSIRWQATALIGHGRIA